MHRPAPHAVPLATTESNCHIAPGDELKKAFVDIIQKGRIAAGQCPALRPVFLKTHGIARGYLEIRRDLPNELRIGLLSGSRYPAWVRFSSDTLPAIHGFKTTVGIGVKLFGVPGKKLFGDANDVTLDLILQNHPVFFVDNAVEMCRFIHAGVVEGDYDLYLRDHPETSAILDAMAKPLGSVLASPYWSILPFALGPDRVVKYRLSPTLTVEPPLSPPSDPDYLAHDLAARLAGQGARLELMIQQRTDPATQPLDNAMTPWDETASPFTPVADLILPAQDIAAAGQAEAGENLSFNIWRVTAEHAPQGSLADARRGVYAAAATLRRTTNGVADSEPGSPSL